MHSTGKLFATTMIAAAAAVSAALALSPAAAAQPAAPAVPSVPGLPFIQQLASNPAAASQLMQGLTSMLGTAQAPAATPPAATASVTLPQPPTALPGMPGAAAAPAAPAAPAPQNLLSSLPTGLASLLPQGTPLTGLLPAAAPAATAALPAATAPAAVAPAAIAPAAAAPAAGAGMAPLLMPLSALP